MLTPVVSLSADSASMHSGKHICKHSAALAQQLASSPTHCLSARVVSTIDGASVNLTESAWACRVPITVIKTEEVMAVGENGSSGPFSTSWTLNSTAGLSSDTLGTKALISCRPYWHMDAV